MNEQVADNKAVLVGGQLGTPVGVGGEAEQRERTYFIIWYGGNLGYLEGKYGGGQKRLGFG